MHNILRRWLLAACSSLTFTNMWRLALAVASALCALAADSQASNRHNEDFAGAKHALLSPLSQGLIDQHIVGGNMAKPGQFPYQVALLDHPRGRQFFCGGSIIDAEWILTAAHCAKSTYRIEVVAGALDISTNETTQQRIVTETRFSHHMYSWRNMHFDIALLKLPTKLVFNEFVQPIRLPSTNTSSYRDKKAIISGWGLVSDTDLSDAKELRYVETRVVSNFYCRFRYFFTTVTDNNVCTSGWHHKGHCNGDSGGPMVVREDDGELTLVGVNAFAFAFSCEYSWPSGHTRVSKFLGWINDTRNSY